MTTNGKTTKTAQSNGQGFDAFSMMNPEAFKDGYERFAKSATAFADFQKGSLEAVMACAGAYARGLEKAASEQTAFVKEAYEDGVSAAKSATSAGSVQEAFEVQSAYAQSALEKNMSFATKIADHWSGVTREATDPLSKRYGEFVEVVQTYRP